jgi:hypothetical protein
MKSAPETRAACDTPGHPFVTERHLDLPDRNGLSNTRRGIAGLALLCLLYVAVAVAALGVNPLAGQTVTPFDVLVSQRAWAFVDPSVDVRNFQRSDTLNALLPNWIEARDQIRDGELPLWSDISGGDTIFTPVYCLFTPAFAIFAAAPEPAVGFYLAIVFNLAVAGVGMHLFLRRHVGWLAALFGAVSFELCGFHAAWLYWPHVLTSIWAPWLLLAIRHCWDQPCARRALPIAIASALVVLGGFPFVGEVIFGTAVLYGGILWLFDAGKPGSRWAFPVWCAVGIAFGFFLCAIPLYELVQWMQQLDLGYREGRGSYLGLRHLDRLIPTGAYQHRRVEETMYVGAIMLAAALAGIAWWLARLRRVSAIAIFGATLLVVSAGLVFEVWPMWLVGWIPGMSFNSWSRAIVILDIALIVLGAFALDQLWRRGDRRPWLKPLLCFVVLVQVVEIGHFFRLYNGPVDASYYYPETPAIAYMQRRAGPFDYVVADKSFLFSGTLGAYGLREWFAHQFRPLALQAALVEMAKDPFTSRTASRLQPGTIRPQSPTMATFNVRYLAVSSRDPGARTPVARSAEHVAIELKAGRTLTQPFHVTRDRLVIDGFSVRLATYRRHGLPGRVILALRASDGALRGVSAIDAFTVVDNAYADFYFQGPVELRKGRYEIRLAHTAAVGAPPLAAWSVAEPKQGGRLTLGGTRTSNALDYVVHVARTTRGQFRRVFTAGGISILENTNHPGGPYFISTLSQQPGGESARQVSIQSYRPGRFELRYTGAAPGYVVVPMRRTREWHVRVDGKQVTSPLKEGLLPAVPVTGHDTIEFEYVPVTRRWIVPWLLVVGTVLIAVGLSGRRRPRSA